MSTEVHMIIPDIGTIQLFIKPNVLMNNVSLLLYLDPIYPYNNMDKNNDSGIILYNGIDTPVIVPMTEYTAKDIYIPVIKAIIGVHMYFSK